MVVIRERLFPALLVLLMSLAFVGWLGASEAAAEIEAIPKQVLTAKAGKKVYTLKAKKLKKKPRLSRLR